MIGVAGLGLIGGSLLQGLVGAGVPAMGFDADGAPRQGFDMAGGIAELARECDVVVVCVPPRATAAVVEEALAADARVVVADACSVKVPIARAVSDARFVPAHPLAGSEAAGWASADPALLRDAVWAVCPRDGALEPLCAVSDALAPLGARFVACTPEEHDAAVARTSHVPHLVAAALARLTSGDPLAAALSGGAFRDMTRVAAADSELWRAIVSANRGATSAALTGFRDQLADLGRSLTVGEEQALAAAWREGAASRARVEALRWREPEWRARTVSGRDELLELGRAGVAVRRLRIVGGSLELDAAG